MAHRGPAAKNVKHGRTPTADWTEVLDVPFAGPSPDLPRLPRRQKWHPMVEQWWAQVREMPHCALWRATDWLYALETAHMKHAYWLLAEQGEATTTAAVEIRRREDQMGTTLEALRKLRIRYLPAGQVDDLEDVPEPDIEVTEIPTTTGSSSGGTVTSLHNRRSRLTRPASA
jgi:hypothetical protein